MKLKSKIIFALLLVGCMFVSALNVNAERTSLHDAVEDGNVEEVAALCEEHPEWLSEKDDAYRVPLMYAETPEMIDCLVKHGAKLESVKLSWVIVAGRAELAKYMIENGADVDCGLFVATSVGDEDLVKYMVEHGANVTKALPAAIVVGNIDLIKYFIEHGADINVKDNQGRTLLNNMVNWCKNYEADPDILRADLSRLSEQSEDVAAEDVNEEITAFCKRFESSGYENIKSSIAYLRSIGAEE